MKDNQPDQINEIICRENYCIPKPNEIKIISHKQTMSLILGSCTSTIFIARKDKFYMGANHIILANPGENSIIGKKGAEKQIEEILSYFKNMLNISEEDIICLHLIGGGHKVSKDSKKFHIHIENIKESKRIINEKNFHLFFEDTGSYITSNYSIYNQFLSIFLENKFKDTHISFTINIDSLFDYNHDRKLNYKTKSMIEPNEFFEDLVEKKIITDIIGEKNRKL